MINPRETFRQSPIGKGWLDLVDSSQFQIAAQTALAQMEMEANPATLGDATAHAYQMQGAKIFLRTLMHLTAPDAKPITPRTTNLNHKA